MECLFSAFLMVTEVGAIIKVLKEESAACISLAVDEDGLCLQSLTVFYVGQEVALWVKENFKKELVKLQSFKSKLYREALEEVFVKLDEQMLTPAGQRRLMELQATGGDFGDTGKSFAGATATVIIVTRTEIYCANAGDSRTVLARAGRAKEMSEDHKPDNAGELARI